MPDPSQVSCAPQDHPPAEPAILEPSWRQRWRPLLGHERVVLVAVLVLGLMVTGLASRTAATDVHRDRGELLARRAAQTRSPVDLRATTYVQTLYGIRGLFAASDSVTRREFETFVDPRHFAERYPGAVAISFDRAVPAADIASFEAAVRGDTSLNGVGYPGFAVHPANSTGIRYVIDYIAPMTGNETALGFDAGSEVIRRRAMEDARDTGDAIATPPIRLVQDQVERPAFLLFLAVYDTDEVPVTTAARRRHFIGAATIAVRDEDMISGALTEQSDVDFEVYDVGSTTAGDIASSSPGTLLYDSNPARRSYGSESRASRDLDVGTRRWRLVVSPTSAFTIGNEETPLGIAVVGGILTALLAALLWSFARSQRRAEQLATDMTVDLRAHAAERSHLAAIVEASSGAALRIDPDGTIATWNLGATQLYGYEASEAIGQPITMLVPEYEREGEAELHRRVLAGERIVGVEMERVRKGGGIIHVSISLSPITGPDGSVVGISRISYDITERKLAAAALVRAHEQLEERAVELQRSNAELERFAYIASHDLQEPLRMVSSFVGLLGERYADQLDERGQRYVHYAVDGAHRMRALIEALLEYSRVGRAELQRQPTDLTELVDEVLVTVRTRIVETGARFEISPMPELAVDRVLMGQLFQNLIVNALKFHRPDRAPEVHVTATRGAGNWTFAVDDNGIGIEPKHHQRVFEVFKRLHSAAEYPGTGIGLAVCTQIVERHNGRIWVEESPMGGARFVFTVPDPEEEGEAQ